MNIFNDDSNFIYLLNNMGCKIKINSKEEQALISNYKDKIIDYKKIKTIIPLNTGDLIQYQNSNWIIISEVSKNNTIYKATMRKAHHLLKIYIDNTLQEIPIIIETGTQGVFENSKIELLDGNIKLTCQFNNITKKINNGCRFIKMQNCWEVQTKTSEIPGLLYLYCKNSEFNISYDNLDLEIVDYWKYNVKHSYNMIIDTIDIEIEEGQTKQLVVNITDTIDNKTENVVNPAITYISNDNSIITIDAKGLIQAIKEGTSTINIQFETVQKIINIKVVKPLPIVVTYQFKSITLDDTEFTGDTITLDNGTSKVLKITEVTKTTTQGDKVTEEVINNPIVAYSCNNANISVDATGKIQGVNAGNSIVTIAFENIKKDINVTIADVVKLEITGKTSVVLNRSTTYTSNIPCTWSVEDINNTTSIKWVTITSSTDTSCTIKVTKDWIFNDNKSKYFKITAISKDDSNIKAEMEVKITIN